MWGMLCFHNTVVSSLLKSFPSLGDLFTVLSRFQDQSHLIIEPKRRDLELKISPSWDTQHTALGKKKNEEKKEKRIKDRKGKKKSDTQSKISNTDSSNTFRFAERGAEQASRLLHT